MSDYDVFISYSRRDDEAKFVSQIKSALEAAELEVWMDTVAMRTSQEWWKQICENIERSDNFLLIISENSLGSEWCQKEIEHALKFGKRIIPFQYVEIDERRVKGSWVDQSWEQIARANWKPLSDVQWIKQYLETGNFAATMMRLIDDARTDLVYVQAHTQLLLQAQAWTRAGRSPGSLISGDTLAEAEKWLATWDALSINEKTQPQPTDEQRAFLAACRAAQNEGKRLADEQERRTRDLVTQTEALSEQTKLAAAENERLARRTARFRLTALIAGVIGVAAIVAAVFGFREQQAAAARADQANLQVAYAISTLTEIPATLTQVADQANEQIGNAQATVAGVGTSVAETLTPIPPTLTKVAGDVLAAEGRVESLRLAALANDELATGSGDIESIALVGIRALKAGYSPQADKVLVEAMDKYHTLRVISGHAAPINGVAYSPDGRTILTGAYGVNTAKLWDVETGTELYTFSGHTDAVSSVAFSPDGRFILTGSWDKTAKLWEISSGREVHTFSGHTKAIGDVAFSPSGQMIALASFDGSATLWNVETGELLRTFRGHTDALYAIAFSSDERHLLTASVDDTAKLWDAVAGEELHTFAGHQGNVISVAFSPDGSTVLTGAGDGMAKLWDAVTGNELRTLSDHSGSVSSVAFSPDGSTILTASGNTAVLWDAETGKKLRTFSGHLSFVYAAVFSPDGRQVLTGSADNTARLWDAEVEVASDSLWRTSYSIFSYSPDRKYVLTDSANNTATLWDAASGKALHILNGHTKPVNVFAFSPDGRLLLTGSSDQTAKLWDTASGKLIYDLVGHTNRISRVAFNPDGQKVLTSALNETTKIWDVASGKEMHTFISDQPVDNAQFSPDGRYILACSGNVAVFWDAVTYKEVRRFSGHSASVNGATFSPDSHLVLTSSSDGTARLWNVDTGETIHILGGHTDEVFTVLFSPDGRIALTTSFDNTVRLWDAGSGQLLHVLSGHSGTIYDVIFSTDGRTVLTGSADTTAIIWDAVTGQTLRVLSGHKDVVISVAFINDGQQVITSSQDGTTRLWNIDYQDFIVQACTRLVRELTSDERARFQLVDHESTCPQFAESGYSTLVPFRTD